METNINIVLTQKKDKPKYKGNVYKKCDQCSRRRKPLNENIRFVKFVISQTHYYISQVEIDMWIIISENRKFIVVINLK